MAHTEITLTASAPARSALDDHGALRGALGLAVVTLAGFGFLYSLAGVGVGQALFPATASGSVIQHDGRVVGSALVAQPFASERYFQPRPSAADFNPMALSGSNQARTNQEMRQRLAETRAAVAQREKVDPSTVPNELVTSSGGGIDPHITPEGAAVQVGRVARSRGLPPSDVERLVAEHTEPRQTGVLGQARVNVLLLNLALDAASGSQRSGTQDR